MATGNVKFFNESRGYGFIVPADGGPDLFVHASSVEGETPLQSGQAVSFEVTEDKRGQRAVDVKVLQTAART
jgi:CspA family cold shock protein